MAKGKLTVYHYPQCGTCRKAIKWLKDRGWELDLHHIVEEQPSAQQLKTWIPQSGTPIQKWFNTSGEVYRQSGMKDKLASMTDEEKIAALAGNGKLLKRPIVTDGHKVTVGFKEDEFENQW
jgi:arsenate reductase